MGTSMSDPRAPEINRQSHKIKTVHPQEPCQSLDYKVVVSAVSQSRRTLSLDQYRKKVKPTIRTNFISDPQNDDLEKTPLFSPSFPDNYLQLPTSKPINGSGQKTNNGQKLALKIQQEDNYQLRPSLLAQRQSLEGVSTYSFLDGNEEEIKLPLNSKIKEPEYTQLTFSYAIESNQPSGDLLSNRTGTDTNNTKIAKLMAKMIHEEKHTSDLLNRYLPKSRVEVQKNPDIKLVVSRNSIGKTIDQPGAGRNYQGNESKMVAGKANKVQVYYTNLKRKLNKRKKSIPRLEQRPHSKTNTEHYDYYQLSKKIKTKESTGNLKEQRKEPELEKRRQERTQHGKAKLRTGIAASSIGPVNDRRINIKNR